MNSIVSINKEEDTSKITKETKYINIPIDIVDNNINNYFILFCKYIHYFYKSQITAPISGSNLQRFGFSNSEILDVKLSTLFSNSETLDNK